MEELEVIRGGWRNVPEGLHTKTQLSKMGLKPVGGPVARVWSYHNWVFLYDIKNAKEKKKPSAKQLAALERARLKKIELEEIRLEEERRYEEEAYKREQEAHKEYWFNVFNSWYKRDFVILDTETTSLDGEIVDIALIDREGKILFNSLVKPKTSVTREAFNVHGISDDMLATAPTWPEVFPKIAKILKDRLILIYNDIFDRSMIYNTCDLWGIEPPKLETDCVMRSYSDYYNCRWVSLGIASGDYVEHRALGDCFSTLKVIKEVWQELGIIQLEEGVKQ
jgi:DNA polymerase-3 subunit epsilon